MCLKCTKTHLRASVVPIFYRVISRTSAKEGRDASWLLGIDAHGWFFDKRFGVAQFMQDSITALTSFSIKRILTGDFQSIRVNNYSTLHISQLFHKVSVMSESGDIYFAIYKSTHYYCYCYYYYLFIYLFIYWSTTEGPCGHLHRR